MAKSLWIIRLLFVYWVFNICNSTIFAQEYVASFNHISTEDGLPDRAVESIYQDSRDFIWVTTRQSLSRYDGYEFKNFTKDDGLSKGSSEIKTEDAEGYLWIYFYDEKEQDKIKLVHIETGEVISFIDKFGEELYLDMPGSEAHFLKGKDGSIYFANKNKTAIYTYLPDKGFQKVELAYQEGVELIDISSSNTIWAHKSKQESSFYNQHNTDNLTNHYKDVVLEIDLDGKVLQRYDHNGYLGSGCFLLKNDELYYFEEYPNGIGDFYRIDINRRRWRMTKDSIHLANEFEDFMGFYDWDYLEKSNTIFALQRGRIVLLTFERGVVMEVNDYFPELNGDEALGYKGYLIDKNGSLWLGGDFGFYKIDIQKSSFRKSLYEELKYYTNLNKGLATRDIVKMDNDLLIATEGRDLVKLSESNGHYHAEEHLLEGNIDNNCWSIKRSKNNRIYCGCFPYLLEVDPDNWKSKIIKEENSNNVAIWSMYEDDQNLLWIGEANGIKTLDAKDNVIRSFNKYNRFTELQNTVVLDIAEDRHGTIWLSTNSGFYTLDTQLGITSRYWSGGEGEFYLPTDNVHHYYLDEEDIFWLATGGDGLIRWDQKRDSIQQFTTSEGLSSNVLYAVYEDGQGQLWISSDHGIIQFDKHTFATQTFLLKDGITHEEFNRVSHLQEEDGTIHFGGLNGITSFHPRDIVPEQEYNNLQVRITKFLQFDGDRNELVDRTDDLVQSQEIRMNPEDRFFQLEFALLAYEDVAQIKYAYIIEGQDKEWNEQDENSIRLSRLPYGSYNLKIKARASDGRWSQNEILIKLTVLRPFYLQLWFVILSFMSVILFGYWIYRINLDKSLATAESKRILDIDSLKTKLYTYISHEFRTPLTVIMGMADNIKDQSLERTLIKRNSQNLLHLVNQLLDLSKLDTGSLKVNLKQADIVAYLQYLIESFYSMSNDHSVRLTFDSEQKEIMMDFDELKIQQIIYNLVSNAIKFNKEHGIVAVFARIEERAEGAFIQIRIKDTGVGIASENVNRIFDRFYQVDDSATRSGEGTGIGLALTKDLIELMGGTISVESELNKGTAFTFLLPITNEAPMGSFAAEKFDKKIEQSLNDSEGVATDEIIIADSQNGTNSGNPEVLIIEDNPDVRTYIQSCIQDSYMVHIAVDGKKGLHMAFEIIPDIIISDVMMPGKDGFEVTQILKNDARTSHIPIILLTAKASVDDKVQGLEVGADAYLMKPFHKEELLVRLRKLIELRIQLHSHFSKLSDEPAQAQKILSLDELFIGKLNSLIRKELGNPDLNASNLCQEVTLSQAQLYRKIKALTGKTPALYIRSIRLKRAMQLLKEGNLNVSEVAYEVGFSDPNYFSRIFAKEFKKTPSHFLQ